MKFVAPEQAPEQAEIIRNTPFWPDVDLSEFRSVMRTDGTVTQPRLKQVALSAISEVNAELYEFRRRQQMLGYASLAEVPAEQLDGKSERIQHYFNAVYCWAHAMLNERYQDYDATASGVKRGEELAEASGDLWRDARWAISRVAGAPLALLRRGLASSGNAAGLLTAPLSSLRRTASLTGNVLKTVAGVPVALLRSGLSGLRAVAVMFMNPLAALRGGLAAAGAVLRVLASGPLAMLRVALYAISGLLSAQLATCGKQPGKSSSVHAVSGTGKRHADAFRCSYAGDNRRQAVVAGTGADGRTGESMAPD